MVLICENFHFYLLVMYLQIRCIGGLELDDGYREKVALESPVLVSVGGRLPRSS